ncbi:MAG TPA: BMP family ABC transporter substrate-binding protein [Candidatus Dormibacteraeota bacterium]|nr:BMP family ABC transporter substrate-binding protein [Candidatus Dormibacteraeota bacterium]
MKLTTIAALAAVGIVLLVACGGSGTSSKLSVTFVSDVGGLNDKGYNEYTYLGMKQGASKVHATLHVIESSGPGDYVSNISTGARESQLVVVAGPSMTDAMKQVSEEFRDRKFAIIDSSYDPPLPNVQGDVFAANQSSYLGGIVAAGISKTHVIGFVGGQQIPALQDFLAGFEAGALAERPDIHIKVAWTGSFTDQQKGKEAALAEIAQGADVIYTAAGASGLGGIAAAQQSHVWAIGVDQDQHDVAPDTVVTSVVKHVDVAAADNVIAVSSGSWKPGTKQFDLANDGVGLAPYHNLASVVPASVQQAVQRAKQEIIAGKISVPHQPPLPNGN